MERKQIHDIIRSFFGKRYSKETQLNFRYWFLLKENEDEKDKSVLELWKESPSVITDKTWDDLANLKKRIDWGKTKSVRYYYLKYCKYVAVVAIVVATVLITKWMNGESVRIISPKMTEFYVSYGECRHVNLPDGTSVWVDAGSLLVYPSEFITDTRTVYLMGKARFEVVKDPDKPFIVSTDHLDVQALGTVFSIDAYPDEPTTSATLEKGSIRVNAKEGEIITSNILRPNERLVYSHQTHQILINHVEADKLSAWKDGHLIFENASFGEMVVALERKYNVTINYDAKKYKGRSYFVKFNPEESVEEAMLVLSRLINDFQYTIKERTISIN